MGVTHIAMRSRRQTNTFNSRQAFGYDFQVTTFSMSVYLILTFFSRGLRLTRYARKTKKKTAVRFWPFCNTVLFFYFIVFVDISYKRE